MGMVGRNRGRDENPAPLGAVIVAQFRALPRNRDAAIDALLALVAAHRQVPPALLDHRQRCTADIAAARQLAMYLAHVVLGRSLTDVGRAFGRDRTTVRHACALIEDMRDDAAIDAEIESLEHRLTAETTAVEAIAEPGPRRAAR